MKITGVFHNANTIPQKVKGNKCKPYFSFKKKITKVRIGAWVFNGKKMEFIEQFNKRTKQ